MADKIEKFLSKLSITQRTAILELVQLLKQGKMVGLRPKKLVGHQNVFRIRKGRIRIIYQITQSRIELLEIGNRDDNTYNKF
jgi:mRNA-degrading endonuclease RelE of RelBE toxin-antitoxin system